MAPSARGSLSEYKKKRNFLRTKEPAGRLSGIHGKKKAKNLLFVVQEHHARRLHYDFRLELDGVLKSWAVPKGVSLDPKVKRLAVQTEDHPFDYAKFTGVIPKGEYGAGRVYRWDLGTWQPVGDPHTGLKKGHLEFILKGEKLNGQFVLVRTGGKAARAGPKSNWLLIKRSDEGAHEEGEELARTSKPKAVRTSTIEFVPPQLARLSADPPLGSEWVHEIKYDGYRLQILVKAKQVKIFTRNGLNWTEKFPEIKKGIETLCRKVKIKSAIFDGEVVWVDDEGQQSFQKLQNSLKDGNHEYLSYFAFDLLHLNGEDLRFLPLLERKKRLQKIVKAASHPIFYSEHYATPATEFFAAACKYGLEGIVSKRVDSGYASGRGPQWMKIKCKMSDEFVIGGYQEGEGARSALGALLLGQRNSAKAAPSVGPGLRYVGKVGTGFNETTLKDLKKRLTKLERKSSPFDTAVPRMKAVHWVKPQLVAEVDFASWTDDKILRAPVFHGVREDKSVPEIHVSHPDRVIYPKEKITKEQVAMYFQVVAEHMLPHITHRYLALVRCQKSAADECFYQKHLPGEKEEVHIASETELLQLVQMGALEFHTWGSTIEKPNYPNQFVIDFDPGPGVAWTEVVASAFELRKLLERLNLPSYVKTTGGKGLHVHVPIQQTLTFEKVKAFTKALADQLVLQNPGMYIANMKKSLRGGKIFVDYLRNGRGATAIAPYCLRAKPVSAVAMPVEWGELKKITASNQFTMVEALNKISQRKKDPWVDYFVGAPELKI